MLLVRHMSRAEDVRTSGKNYGNRENGRIKCPLGADGAPWRYYKLCAFIVTFRFRYLKWINPDYQKYVRKLIINTVEEARIRPWQKDCTTTKLNGSHACSTLLSTQNKIKDSADRSAPSCLSIVLDFVFLDNYQICFSASS